MNNRQPLFRVVKREGAGPGRQLLAYLSAILLALAIGAALLWMQGVDPATFYKQMLTMGIPGSRYPWRAVENFIKLFVPLLIVSLALALALGYSGPYQSSPCKIPLPPAPGSAPGIPASGL